MKPCTIWGQKYFRGPSGSVRFILYSRSNLISGGKIREKISRTRPVKISLRACTRWGDIKINRKRVHDDPWTNGRARRSREHRTTDTEAAISRFRREIPLKIVLPSRAEPGSVFRLCRGPRPNDIPHGLIRNTVNRVECPQR